MPDALDLACGKYKDVNKSGTIAREVCLHRLVLTKGFHCGLEGWSPRTWTLCLGGKLANCTVASAQQGMRARAVNFECHGHPAAADALQTVADLD
jgi:hypothetical protein